MRLCYTEVVLVNGIIMVILWLASTKALMRAAGCGVPEGCQRLIFPSVVGALIDKSRGSRLV